MLLRIRFLFFILFSLFLSNHSLIYAKAVYVEDKTQSIGDETSIKSFQLENNLKVLVRSNPNRTLSSVALSVDIGSLYEDPNKQGMAHYLEHLLFLTTEKYPALDEYQSFIAENSGESNAYTSSLETNYHFNIDNSKLNEALDRFAQFFIKPLFNKEYTEKEKSAVDGEFARILDNRNFAEYLLNVRLTDATHPIHFYHPGNATTLDLISVDDVIKFYQTYYSAENMTLVIDSNHSIKDLEKMAKEYFSPIKNTGNKTKLFSRPTYNTNQLPLFIEIKSKKPEPMLTLSFNTNSTQEAWKSKPGHILGHIIGHEGKGSLLSSLKKDDLVTSLSAGYEEHDYYGQFEVNMRLTQKGVQLIPEIVQRYFNLVKKIKTADLKNEQKYIFQELITENKNNFLTSNQNATDSLGEVISLATLMHKYPTPYTKQRNSLIYEFEEESWNAILEYLRPENMRVTFSHPSADNLTQKDEELDLEYSTSQINLNDYDFSREYVNITLPRPNSYLAPIEEEELKSDLNQELAPEKITLRSKDTLWYQWDHWTKLPKSAMVIDFKSPLIHKNAKNYALLQIYTKVFINQINELLYEMGLSQNNHHFFTFYQTDLGLSLIFSAYNPSFLRIFNDLKEELKKDLNISNDELQSILNNQIQNIQSNRLDTALQQILTRCKENLIKYNINPDELYNEENGIDMFSTITLEELNQFKSTFYQNLEVNILFLGQIPQATIAESIIDFLNDMKISPLKDQEIIDQEVTKEIFSEQMNRKLQDSGYGQYILLNKANAKENALLMLGESFFSTDFFTELRTKKELCYALTAQPYPIHDHLGYVLLLESSKVTSNQIKVEFTNWKTEVIERYKNTCSDEQFLNAKISNIHQLKEKDLTLSSLLKKLIHGIKFYQGNCQSNYQIADEMERLTKDDVLKYYQECFNENIHPYSEIFLDQIK